MARYFPPFILVYEIIAQGEANIFGIMETHQRYAQAGKRSLETRSPVGRLTYWDGSM